MMISTGSWVYHFDGHLTYWGDVARLVMLDPCATVVAAYLEVFYEGYNPGNPDDPDSPVWRHADPTTICDGIGWIFNEQEVMRALDLMDYLGVVEFRYEEQEDDAPLLFVRLNLEECNRRLQAMEKEVGKDEPSLYEKSLIKAKMDQERRKIYEHIAKIRNLPQQETFHAE